MSRNVGMVRNAPLRELLLCLVFLTAPLCAQTEDDANMGTRLSYDRANSLYTLSWWGRSGRSYFVQHSEDLLMWGYFPTVFTGEDLPAALQFQTTAKRYFLRIEETQDVSYDSAGDGIPDEWEVRYGLNPHNPYDASGMAPGGLS